MSTQEIALTVAEIRELKRMQEEIAEQIDALQDCIKEVMHTRSVDELAGADYKITWKAVTSSRLDSTALKKELPDIAARFMRTATARRFVLA